VGVLMLPLAAMSVVITPLAVRAIDRFGVRRVLIAGVVLLTVAAAALWLLTASFAVLLVLALTALMGVPYGSVSIASNQGLYLPRRRRTGAWPPGSSRPAGMSGPSAPP
jgi:MFS family permease